MNFDPSIAPPDEPDPALGRVVRRLREERGLSADDLARRAEVDPEAMARLEAGSVDPSWATVGAIARALGVSIESIAEAAAAERGEADGS